MNYLSETIRKAAILVSILDRDSADALLDQMEPQQAALVRNAVIELDDIPADEQRRVVDEFLRVRKPAPASPPASDDDQGVELELSGEQPHNLQEQHPTENAVPSSAGERLADEQLASSPINERPWLSPAPSAASAGTAPLGETASPFQFLHTADGQAVAALLTAEHPQTIAVVLAHLPAPRAAAVLARLPVQTQTEVIRRMVDREETDPAILRDVEATLETHFAQQLRNLQRRELGVAAMQSILGATEQQTRNSILANLSARDTELAARLTATAGAANAPETSDHAAGEQRQSPRATFPARDIAARDVGLALPMDMPVQTREGAHPPAPEATPVAHRFDPAPVIPPRRASVTKRAAESNWEAHERNAGGAEKSDADRSPRVEFDDLMRLDDQSLGVVLHAADPRTTMLALAGASDQLVHRILRQLPARKARILQRQIEQQGPLRLRDIEAAQQSLSHLAGQLAARGMLRVPTAKGFAVAA